MLHILAHTEAQEPASATTDQMGSSSSVPFSTSMAPTGALLFPLCFTNHAKVIAIHGDNLKELDAPSSTDLYFRAEQALPRTVQIKFSFFFFFEIRYRTPTSPAQERSCKVPCCQHLASL